MSGTPSASTARSPPRSQSKARLDKLGKVKEMLQGIIEKLMKEKDVDIKQKDLCIDVFNQNELETSSDDREKSSKDFQLTVADQRATQKLIIAALNILKGFYEACRERPASSSRRTSAHQVFLRARHGAHGRGDDAHEEGRAARQRGQGGERTHRRQGSVRWLVVRRRHRLHQGRQEPPHVEQEDAPHLGGVTRGPSSASDPDKGMHSCELTQNGTRMNALIYDCPISGGVHHGRGELHSEGRCRVPTPVATVKRGVPAGYRPRKGPPSKRRATFGLPPASQQAMGRQRH